MAVDHKEIALEAAIEDVLLSPAGGWLKGAPHDYDPAVGLDTNQLFAFVADTQAEQWAKLVKLLGGDEVSAREKFARRVGEQIDARGTVDVLRRGVKEHGIQIDLAYFKPAHGLTPELMERYAKNRLSVTRQLMYSAKTDDELDLGLFANGVPVATGELKNQLTGQDVEDAIKQYREDRDQKELLFARRALAHFAVDPDLVFLTTKLEGKKTDFLPFNRGSEDHGKGNPENPNGYKTSYLWERVWQRDAWLDILHRFVHLETRQSENGKAERTIVFPRYHQWDAVLKLAGDAQASGAGKSYLAEHSAGSGKSKTISWLSHRLSTLYDADDERIFDQVIIITDRVVLDRQLRDDVAQFEAKKGVVEKIEHGSKQLAQVLAAGTAPIVVTTLQKFPFAQVLEVLIEKAAELKGRRYAVIVDEAHSSQTGDAAASVKAVLGSGSAHADEEDAEEGVDVEDQVVAALTARGAQPNLSFFAFTATPKAKTLELFGTPGVDGRPEAVHLYSMRQAIEEGFILDVLENYTTYTTFWKVAKNLDDDPEVVKPEAAAAIARFVSLHPTNIAQKVEIMVEHFASTSATKIGGRAKAMVVTQSRLHAVRYKLAIDRYLVDRGYPFTALVAFSDSVHDVKTGLDYTESQMNGFAESQTAEKFKADASRFLIVAEKYQTGFDQPLLHTMYVDKKLEGVRAVQTLSRLNRIYPAGGKEDTFVLDFRNTAEEMQESFSDYYVTTIAEPTDPNVLFDAEAKLLESDVIRDEDVDAFAATFFKSKGQQSKNDNALLYAHLAPAKARLAALDEDEQEEFRKTLARFVRVYAFLSQIVPYLEGKSERLYVYARFLAKYVRRTEDGGLDLGEDEVTLTHLRQVKTGEHKVKLGPADEPLASFTGDGTGEKYEPETGKLSEIIDVLNERFGLTLTEADELYFEQIEETLIKSGELKAQAQANEIDNFRFPFEQKFDAAVVDRQEANEELFKKMLEDTEFRDAVKEVLLKKVYGRLSDDEPPDSAQA
jgi:type I restriction enzyme, R subunit